MQRAADKRELEAQPPRKKPRFVCYPDRISEAVRQALYDADAKVPTLNDRPVVIWCVDDSEGGETMALLYWPCDQLIGENLVRALCYGSLHNNKAQHARLIEDITELALGYLSDYKAAKPTLPQYAEMKKRVVDRFLSPGQPLSALGQLAVMAAEGNTDTQPYDWSKHGNGCINECELNPHLFYVHCRYTATSNGDNTVAEEEEEEEEEEETSDSS